ncbi:MAG: hypothetical protein AAF410_06735 [Pseudomonadota bacterium]
MFFPADEQKQIARLFAFLLQGEQLAFDCAKKQAELFTDKRSQRFLKNQVRQERFHSQVFKSGVGILAPRGVINVPGQKEMQTYRQLVTEALDRGDKAESLLGMQIMLEGVGDVAVQHISAGFDYRDVGFMCRRVRHLILGQEDAHHTFGIKRFNSLFDSEDVPDYLQQRSQDYLHLLEALMLSVTELFEYFDESAEHYIDEFYAELPDWIATQRT